MLEMRQMIEQACLPDRCEVSCRISSIETPINDMVRPSLWDGLLCEYAFVRRGAN